MSESCIRSGDEQAVNFLKNSVEIVGISVFLIYLNSHLQDVKRNVPLVVVHFIIGLCDGSQISVVTNVSRLLGHCIFIVIYKLLHLTHPVKTSFKFDLLFASLATGL